MTLQKTIAATLQARLRLEQFLGANNYVQQLPRWATLLPDEKVSRGEKVPPSPLGATTEVKQAAPRITGDALKLATAQEIFATTTTCTQCTLCASRRQVVFGEGDLAAKILFVGDAPGKDDDFLGRPFISTAGELLTDIIEKGLEIPRRNVFITNIVKCRPVGNRDLLPAEIAACLPFLQRQIALLQPRVIVAVGNVAARILTAQDRNIAELRGHWFTFAATPLIAIYHPSFLLRQRRANNDGKTNKTLYDRETWQDVQMIRQRISDPA